jgi:hypothetical protein
MQVSDEMVEKALEAYHATDDFLVDKIRAAIEAALAAMWRTDFESAPFMEPVALAIRDRKLPVACFRYTAESKWRYLESGAEIKDHLVPTAWMPLPTPPAGQEPPRGET